MTKIIEFKPRQRDKFEIRKTKEPIVMTIKEGIKRANLRERDKAIQFIIDKTRDFGKI